MGSGSMGRRVIIFFLFVSALGPLVLLGLWSVGDRWLFPALLPTSMTAEAWRTAINGRLGADVIISVIIALGTAVLSCLLALPVGHAMARLEGWRKRVATAAAFLPVMAPPIALGLGLQYAFVALGLAGTMLGVIIAHVVPATGFLAIYFAGVFTALDPRIEDEARSLGATPLQVWTRITIPIVQGPIGDALALGFLVSWAQVPLTLVIGGGIVRTLPLSVYDYVRSGETRYAATGALLLTVPPILALLAARGWRGERVAPL
jgi:putative spermidine/putrescine transport system permease protein